MGFDGVPGVPRALMFWHPLEFERDVDRTVATNDYHCPQN
jgi:hypothetical protein